MSTLSQVLLMIGAGLMVLYMYKVIKNNPGVFRNRENWNKSFFSMGVLGLVLIAFVSLLIMLVSK